MPEVESPLSLPVSAPAASSAITGASILVIDDEAGIRESLELLLTLEGYSAKMANDGEQGLRALELENFDLVLLDLALPGQSGLDLLKIARRRNYTAVIIMFSVHDHPTLRQRCADLGADFFFHKLTEFERVAEVCRELAGR